MDNTDYVHGYSSREASRLADQAATLTTILHHDTLFPSGSHILEAGCGTGAQTEIIARQNPGCTIHSIDISPVSLDIARKRIESADGGVYAHKVTFAHGDIHDLSFPDGSFDHIILCFVLEHLKEPHSALNSLRRIIKPGGTITLIEGDHGSVYFHPDNQAAMQVVHCQIELQRRAGGDACIGRQLFPLLTGSGFRDIQVSPRMVYVDTSRPGLVDGFTRKTFTAMIEGIKDDAVRSGLITATVFDEGVKGLLRTCEPDGTFCYSFFKATAIRGA
ncbi:MAG TPA: methyltransferase domain-containing protein [Methanospirillum sp.]|nr:methyltransferase domain-containing protein [Methanospirillum sp.]